MADRIDVDIEALKSASATTDGVKDKLKAIMDTLRAGVAEYDNSWGPRGDSIGDQFAGYGSTQGYVAARDSMLTGGDNFADGIHNLSTAQLKTATDLAATETNSASGFR